MTDFPSFFSDSADIYPGHLSQLANRITTALHRNTGRDGSRSAGGRGIRGHSTMVSLESTEAASDRAERELVGETVPAGNGRTEEDEMLGKPSSSLSSI